MFSPISGSRIEYDIKTYRYHRKEKPDKSVKYKVFAGSAIGTVIPLCFAARKQKTHIFNINYGLKEMISTACGSIAGGVAAGLLVDKKERRKQKINEGVFQICNSIIPAVTVFFLLKMADKTKVLNNNFCKISATFAGLFAGMQIAAKTSNIINDPYDKVPDRKLTLKDSVANLDDAIGVLTMAKIPGANKIPTEKILPGIYGLCGYRAGSSN